MSENNVKDMEKNKGEKPKANKRRERKDKVNQSIKIVVRHLPPTMTEEEFLVQVDPLPETDSYYYCPADWSLGQEATCRAYISLKTVADVLQFRDRFDRYVFVDSKGGEYVAIVEYAPFQRFVKNKAKHDNKVNTIESEPHFQEFLQKLTEEREEISRAGDVKIDFTFDRPEEKVKSTPLLQYLANKKEKRREDARKRNEEKRKQREEQKQRQAEQRDKSKDASAVSEGKKSVCAGNSKKGSAKDTQNGCPDEPAKSSRSKRRTERDQRRREEHEKRKLMGDRTGSDRNEKVDREKTGAVKLLKQNKHANKDNQDSNKDIVILRKDNKTEVKKTTAADVVDDTCPKVVVPAEKDACNEVNDFVKDFILAAASINDNDTAVEGSVKEHQSTYSENAASMDSLKFSIQHASEERRIRNKDRPSIAIYQPKARLRLGSEENSQGSSKDAITKCEPRTPPSDDEACLLDDQPSGSKKHKRYGRRNKPKASEHSENADHERRVSKSSESSTSTNSKIS